MTRKQLLSVTLALLIMASFTPFLVQAQILKKFKDKINQTIDSKETKAVNNTVNAADKAVTNAADSVLGVKNGSSAGGGSSSGSASNSGSGGASSSGPTMTAFKNYDFVPGDKIVFEDHFDTDEEGEFPAHWHLKSGQAAVNTFDGKRVFLMTDRGTKAIPAIKTKAYLTDSFTVEFDTYSRKDFGPEVWFYPSEDAVNGNNTDLASIVFNDRHSNMLITPKDHNNRTLVHYPPALDWDTYINKWHHVAIAYKAGLLKVYVDEYRIVSIPEFPMKPGAIAVAGDDPSPASPVLITNFKLAQGAGIKTQQTKFTDTKIVTHGINFDVNKADIRPESMGTLNAIVGILKNNPELKFEIQGHTDNSGTPANNLTLSQKRAESVKKQLVSMGIDESRLTSKGFGDTKPLSDNGTPEGKANNRRVEFVKQ